MKKTTASLLLSILLSLLAVFHILVLLQIIPYTEVWGGRLTTEEEMYKFEGFSLLITLLMLTVSTQHYRTLQKGESKRILNILLWIIFGYFALNTFGNLMAKSIWEMVLGGALTVSLAALSFLAVKGLD